MRKFERWPECSSVTLPLFGLNFPPLLSGSWTLFAKLVDKDEVNTSRKQLTLPHLTVETETVQLPDSGKQDIFWIQCRFGLLVVYRTLKTKALR